MPVAATFPAFRDAVAEPASEGLEMTFDPDAELMAGQALSESGLLLLGEYHGVAENAGIIRSLVERFAIDAIVLEWPPELSPVLQRWASEGRLDDHPSLWLGDGRVTAEHVAVLGTLVREGVSIAMVDRVLSATPGCRPDRDRALADGALEATAGRARALVVAGNAHTPTTDTDLGTPMGARLARARPGAREIRIEYGSGRFFNFATRTFPERFGTEPGVRLCSAAAGLQLRLPRASEATVAQRRSPPPGHAGPSPGRAPSRADQRSRIRA